MSTTLISGNKVCSSIGYGFSDACFVYPITPQQYLGQSLVTKEEEGAENAYGNVTKVKLLETRAGAGALLAGAALGGLKVSAYLSSKSLIWMIPTLFRLTSKRVPAVLHVESYAIDDELSLRRDLTDVLTVKDSGVLIINSKSVQECHDMSIVSHVLAQKLNKPALHVFDGVWTSNEVNKANVLSTAQLEKLVKSDIFSASNKTPSDVIEETLSSLTTVLGKEYKPFEYTGPSDAETILVTIGAQSPVFESAIQNFSGKVGVVSVRFYRPWLAKKFLQALPQTTKRVIVLENSNQARAGRGALFRDVAGSFYSNQWENQVPEITPVAVPLDAQLTPHFAEHIITTASNGECIDLSSINEKTTDLRLIDNNTRQAVFWDLKSAKIQEDTLDLLGRNYNGVQGYFAYDNFEHGEIIKTHVRFGDSIENAPYDVQDADIVMCNDAKIVKRYDVLSSIGDRSTFILNTTWKQDELVRELPFSVKQDLFQKKSQVVTVDAQRIATQVGLSAQQVMQAVFLNIVSPEALTDALTKQLAKASRAGTVDVVKYHINKGINNIAVDPTWLDESASDSGSDTSEPLETPIISVVGTQMSLRAFEKKERTQNVQVGKWYKACLPFIFKEHYSTELKLRPDIVGHGPYLVTLTDNIRLTPNSYHRNIFHLEFDTTGTNLKYEIGDALGIHAHNDKQEVEDFFNFYGIQSDDTVILSSGDSDNIRTVGQVFTQELDLFGRPSKRFYEQMAQWARNGAEKARLRWIIGAEGTDDFKKRVEDTVTFASLLREFPSAHPSVQELVRSIPAIKPRHYSIASSMKMNPNSVHLLVVLVDWKTSSGEKRIGQATNYLSKLRPNTKVTVSVMHSILKLPPNHTDPVIMAGLGTGMAPFRAFIQERAAIKASGQEVGPMILYFGARYRKEEYLYGEELEAYLADGVLTHLRLAFSRDQDKKVYIQHKIEQDAEPLHNYLKENRGNFYLCGPTWPVPDVRKAITDGFVAQGMEENDATQYVQKLKDDERYILEVY